MSDATIGHNSAINKEASDRLKSTIERIERLEEDKKAIADDIKDIYAEAKGVGFDVAALRKIIKTRKRTAEEVQTEVMLFETYCRAMGMSNYLE